MKTQYPEPDRGERREYLRTYRHKKGLSKQDSDSAGIKLNKMEEEIT